MLLSKAYGAPGSIFRADSAFYIVVVSLLRYQTRA